MYNYFIKKLIKKSMHNYKGNAKEHWLRIQLKKVLTSLLWKIKNLLKH